MATNGSKGVLQMLSKLAAMHDAINDMAQYETEYERTEHRMVNKHPLLNSQPRQNDMGCQYVGELTYSGIWGYRRTTCDDTATRNIGGLLLCQQHSKGIAGNTYRNSSFYQPVGAGLDYDDSGEYVECNHIANNPKSSRCPYIREHVRTPVADGDKLARCKPKFSNCEWHGTIQSLVWH